jgi:hypothetical protein
MRIYLVLPALTLLFSATTKAQNVGIGTTIPNHPLTVIADAGFKGIAQKNGTVEIGFWTSAGSAYLQTWSPHDLNFATNNGPTRLTLSNTTGYFGVNAGVPTAHLDVNGTFRLRNNGAAIGRVLVSDALGNATWQTVSSAGGWSLTGNAGTDPSTNFLGTTDNQPLLFRQNNVYGGKFHYGLRNYFIGNQSGVNTIASHNIAVGDSSLSDNISGHSNVAIGSGALQQNPSYSNLVAIGDSALFRNGSFNDGGSTANCTQNTAVGSKALYTNSQGHKNTALGFEAGYKMGLGWSNTAIGAYAMRNGGGFGAEGNVALGIYALDSTTNFHNTGIGAFSLRRNRSGTGNTAVGNNSLSNNGDGEGNTAVGQSALASNVSGDFNTALGSGAGVGSTITLSYATAIGAGASVTQSNSLVLGRTTAEGTNVGVGTTSPAHTLDLQTNSVFGGKVQLRLHETANDYARMRFTNTITASNWEIAGYPNTTNNTSQLNFFFSGLGDVLSLRGDGNATLAGTLTQLSDARLKKNILPIRSSLSKLVQLHGYQYQWRDENKDQSPQLGVLAQEVKKLFPELVKTDEKGLMSVNYSGLVPVLIDAVKQQQQTIESLEKRLATLEQKIRQ